MIKISDILSYLFSIAPKELAENWDNVGLMCGRTTAEVHRVLIALDPSDDAIEEAKACNAQLLVTHHPLLFRAAKSVSDETDIGEKLMKLIENGIAVISMHTNLDIAENGVNDCLADRLGLQDRERFGSTDCGVGLARIGNVEKQELPQFVTFVRNALGAAVRYSDGKKPVWRVAVGGGACIGFMDEAIAAGCDTFVTSDVKYHEFQKAQEMGINLLDVSHFATENPVCFYLQKQLQAQFPELDVRISEKHQDIIEFG